MNWTDEQLRSVFRDATRAPARRDRCLSSARLAALATAGDPDAASVAHLADCSTCAEEYRALRGAMPRTRSMPQWLPLAAALFLAFVLGAAAVVLWNQQPGGAPRELARRPAPESAAAPQILRNVAIVQLIPAADPVRGVTPTEIATIPSSAAWATLILAAGDAPRHRGYALEIADERGAIVQQAGDLRRSEFDTFTVAIPLHLFPAGAYRVHVYGIDEPARILIASYSFRR